MNAHTPTPWRLVPGARPVLVNKYGGRISYVDNSSMGQIEYAAACVNAHDALVARVAELEAALRGLLPMVDGYKAHSAAALDAARAALKEQA